MFCLQTLRTPPEPHTVDSAVTEVPRTRLRGPHTHRQKWVLLLALFYGRPLKLREAEPLAGGGPAWAWTQL